MYMMYSWKYGHKPHDALCYVLFFAHQCNTTTTIISAMCHITSECYEHTRECKKYKSFYTELSDVCRSLKGSSDKLSDTGSGKHPRFQPTNNHIYDDETIECLIHKMNNTFSVYHNKMIVLNSMKTSYSTRTKLKFRLFNDLVNKFDNKRQSLNFKGLSSIRIYHLISLASLLNMLPLDYYVYMPIHFNGGVKSFLQDQIGDKRSLKRSLQEELISWNVNTIVQLQSSFNKSLTLNMLENMLYIIGRKKDRKDIFYVLPRIGSNSKVIVNNNDMQCFYKFNGLNSGKLFIEIFNGKSHHTYLSQEHDLLNRINYLRNQENKIIDITDNHYIDKEWIKEVFTSTIEK